ncbi:MAG: hypothetical protein UY97_C0028G0002 [Parcubacteria group bacterium GW2011_GWB1_57_6]|nr:MAG: hypothetical protein UY97_C0028G0002 [Parcubacteria group bacterium GW2011_GWB1_57_6]
MVLEALDREHKGLHLLQRDLFDSRPAVVLSALDVVARLREPASFQLIARLFTHKNEDIRRAAVEAAGELAHPDAARVLLDLYNLTQGERLRCAILESLWKVAQQDPQVLALVSEVAQSGLMPPAVRATAVGTPKDGTRVMVKLADGTEVDATLRGPTTIGGERAWNIIGPNNKFLQARKESDISAFIPGQAPVPPAQQPDAQGRLLIGTQVTIRIRGADVPGEIFQYDPDPRMYRIKVVRNGKEDIFIRSAKEFTVVSIKPAPPKPSAKTKAPTGGLERTAAGIGRVATIITILGTSIVLPLYIALTLSPSAPRAPPTASSAIVQVIQQPPVAVVSNFVEKESAVSLPEQAAQPDVQEQIQEAPQEITPTDIVASLVDLSHPPIVGISQRVAQTPESETRQQAVYQQYYDAYSRVVIGSGTRYGSNQSAIDELWGYTSGQIPGAPNLPEQMGRGYVLTGGGYGYVSIDGRMALVDGTNSSPDDGINEYVTLADRHGGPVQPNELNDNQRRLYDLARDENGNLVSYDEFIQKVNSRYVGVISAKSPNDIGREFELFRKNADGTVTDIGRVIVGGTAARHDWTDYGDSILGGGDNRLGYRGLQQGEDWVADLPTEIYEEAFDGTDGPVFGVVLVDPEEYQAASVRLQTTAQVPEARIIQGAVAIPFLLHPVAAAMYGGIATPYLLNELINGYLVPRFPDNIFLQNLGKAAGNIASLIDRTLDRLKLDFLKQAIPFAATIRQQTQASPGKGLPVWQKKNSGPISETVFTKDVVPFLARLPHYALWDYFKDLLEKPGTRTLGQIPVERIVDAVEITDWGHIDRASVKPGYFGSRTIKSVTTFITNMRDGSYDPKKEASPIQVLDLGGVYVAIDGSHRVASAKAAGVADLPVVVIQVSDQAFRGKPWLCNSVGFW